MNKQHPFDFDEETGLVINNPVALRSNGKSDFVRKVFIAKDGENRKVIIKNSPEANGHRKTIAVFTGRSRDLIDFLGDLKALIEAGYVSGNLADSSKRGRA